MSKIRMRIRIAELSFLASLFALSCQAQEKPPVTSDSVSSALAQLDSYIHSSLDKTKVPGVAVAVVYNDQVVFLRGYGIRKVGEAARVDPDTVFEIASFSKPITSTVLASLVGEGKINWDDRIIDLDPDFQLSSADTTSQITIRDFLSHRSGLATESGDMLEDLGYSRSHILYRMRYLPLPGQFRKTYAYSNFGYTTGAIAAATKIGRPWEAIAEEQLYSRLGMNSTSSRFSDYENRANKAALHIFLNGEPVNRFVREADAEAPAGGVSSSARDLAEWVRLQLDQGRWNGKQIVDANALAETHKAQICRSAPDPAKPDVCSGDQYYGLGWDVGTQCAGPRASQPQWCVLPGRGYQRVYDSRGAPGRAGTQQHHAHRPARVDLPALPRPRALRQATARLSLAGGQRLFADGDGNTGCVG